MHRRVQRTTQRMAQGVPTVQRLRGSTTFQEKEPNCGTLLTSIPQVALPQGDSREQRKDTPRSIQLRMGRHDNKTSEVHQESGGTISDTQETYRKGTKLRTTRNLLSSPNHPRCAYPRCTYPRCTYPRCTYPRCTYPRCAYPRCTSFPHPLTIGHYGHPSHESQTMDYRRRGPGHPLAPVRNDIAHGSLNRHSWCTSQRRMGRIPDLQPIISTCNSTRIS